MKIKLVDQSIDSVSVLFCFVVLLHVSRDRGRWLIGGGGGGGGQYSYIRVLRY